MPHRRCREHDFPRQVYNRRADVAKAVLVYIFYHLFLIFYLSHLFVASSRREKSETQNLCFLQTDLIPTLPTHYHYLPEYFWVVLQNTVGEVETLKVGNSRRLPTRLHTREGGGGWSGQRGRSASVGGCPSRIGAEARTRSRLPVEELPVAHQPLPHTWYCIRSH